MSKKLGKMEERKSEKVWHESVKECSNFSLVAFVDNQHNAQIQRTTSSSICPLVMLHTNNQLI